MKFLLAILTTAQKIGNSIKPVYIDGLLYVLIALFAYMEATMTSDEAYKYWSPAWLYWTKFLTGAAAAAVGALKMFRSTSYSDHLKQKDEPQPPAASEPPSPPGGHAQAPGRGAGGEVSV